MCRLGEQGSVQTPNNDLDAGENAEAGCPGLEQAQAGILRCNQGKNRPSDAEDATAEEPRRLLGVGGRDCGPRGNLPPSLSPDLAPRESLGDPGLELHRKVRLDRELQNPRQP